MLAKLASPLSSPTLAAAQLRNRLPTQLRRLLPYYIGCIIFVLVFLNLNLFHTGKQQIVLVRPPGSGSGSGSDSTHSSGGAAVVATTSRPVRSEFPKKIWQTWKVNPLAFEERDLNNARSWTGQNPDWRYEVITDGNEMQYVEFHFGPEGFNRPDIVEFYRGVQAAIIKADLLRYLIMYAEGGIYADIDVEAIKPMSRFIPDRYSQKDIDMVVGVEIDEPDWKDHPILGPKSMSFCQWTFMCKPELPVMMHLIEHIMTWLNGVAAGQNRTISDVELDFDEVISGTGPSAFTNAILAEMNNNNKHSGGAPIDWSQFHDIPESKLVSNVLVLTVEAFAAGQGHSNSGNHEARSALVRHHYHASNWPSRHPRYKHPAYGEVENCNWNDECVHRWDDNVAAFEQMNEEEQKRVIAEEDRKREEEERKRKEEEDERRRKEDEDRAREEEERRQEEERRRKEEEDRRAQEEREKEHANPGAAPENAGPNPDAKSPAAEKDKPAP